MNSGSSFHVWTSVVVLVLSSLAGAQSYTVTDLGTLGGPSSGALAVNGPGEVAGFSSVPDGTQHAFFWTSANGMRDLGTLAGDNYSYAQGVNDYHEVVGWSLGTTTGTERAFLWKEQSGMHALGTLGGSYSLAYGINNSHEVVGASLRRDNSEHAFLWSPTGGMQDLGTLGGSTSVATAINDAGEVVGFAWLADNVTYHAFLWTLTGGMQDLGTLGGIDSMAFAVNSTGQIAGWSATPSKSQVAFLFTKSRGMHSLGAGEASVALGVNTANHVVGYMGTNPQSAFVWTTEQHLQDLNNLLSNSSAYGVNKSGQIAAIGPSHAILLTPLP